MPKRQARKSPEETTEAKSARALSDAEKVARGERAKALREKRGLTQASASLKSGLLGREEITKLESGTTLGTTSRFQQGIARAYGIPLELVEPYLSGDRDLDDVISQTATVGDVGYTRYGNIEAALSYHGGRWHPVTVATGRAIALCSKDDPAPPEWAELLDRVQETLGRAKLLPPNGH